jgi:hypothetical protein
LNSTAKATLDINRYSLFVALGLCWILLIKFAIDFSAESVLLVIPFWGLVIGALTLASLNVTSVRKSRLVDETKSLPKYQRAATLAIIPLAFFSASLGCSGLAPRGCTPFCTFVKLVWIPVIALACVLYYFIRTTWLSLAITLMCFVPMAPHCACYNVANRWWIDKIGASPECYVWAFLVSVISMAAIRSGKHAFTSLVIAGLITGGALTFFVSHHYFHFPW